MKLEIKKEIIEYVEVQLPLYKKSSCHWYLVYEENRCLRVCDLRNHEEIGCINASCAFMDTEDCTKEEFDQAYQRISNLLNDLRK